MRTSVSPSRLFVHRVKLTTVLALLLVLSTTFGADAVAHAAAGDTQSLTSSLGVHEPARKPGLHQPAPHYTPAEKQTLDTKLALSEKYQEVLAGKYDRATYQQEWAAFLRSVGESPAKHDAFSNVRPNGVNPNANYTSNYLSVLQASQETGYYCGPAAAYELLSYLGNTTSSYNTQPSLSQSAIAGSDYFQTTTAGTPWWVGTAANKTYVVPRGLNRWRQGVDAGFYVPIVWAGQPSSSQTSTFQNNITSDIDSVYPSMGDAWEVAGYDHLVGHPKNLTIYHWITFTGYFSSGSQLQYADSVYGDGSNTSWSSGVTAAKSQMATSTIAGILGGYGYVW